MLQVWICVAFMWVCSISLLMHLLIVRMKTRQRLAIPGACNSCARFLKDCCIMLWCTTCAMCQVSAGLPRPPSYHPKSLPMCNTHLRDDKSRHSTCTETDAPWQSLGISTDKHSARSLTLRTVRILPALVQHLSALPLQICHSALQENRTLHKKYKEMPMAPHYIAPTKAPVPSKMDV